MREEEETRRRNAARARVRRAPRRVEMIRKCDCRLCERVYKKVHLERKKIRSIDVNPRQISRRAARSPAGEAMSVNPHVLQYLDGKLAATGSQALPYDEWSKPALRDQLLQLVEVRPPRQP